MFSQKQEDSAPADDDDANFSCSIDTKKHLLKSSSVMKVMSERKWVFNRLIKFSLGPVPLWVHQWLCP